MKNARVKLSDILGALEFQAQEMKPYLNVRTGDVVLVSDTDFDIAEYEDLDIDAYPEWQRDGIETAIEILDGDDYIDLPSKFDIDEYGIMEDFCMSIKDEGLRSEMYNSIKGSGAFRRFKNNTHSFNIEDQWYAFREQALKDVAIEWCKENNISFTEE